MSDPNEALQERALGLTSLRKIQQKLKGPEPKPEQKLETRDRLDWRSASAFGIFGSAPAGRERPGVSLRRPVSR